MHVLVIKRIGSKATEKRWRHHFPHYESMGAFCSQGHQSFDPICLKTLCSLSPPPVMLVRDFMHVVVTCKYKKDRIKNNRDKVETPFSPLKVNGGFLLPWKPEFWSKLPQNLMQHFPHPSDATHKFWSRLVGWLKRYSSLKVWTTTDDDDGRTTDGRRTIGIL